MNTRPEQCAASPLMRLAAGAWTAIASRLGWVTLAWAMLLMVAVGAPRAGAQTAACAPPGDTGLSHAWAMVADHIDRPDAGTCVLVHVPPRMGVHPSPVGYVQFARTFEEWPAALAAWDRTIYLVFQTQGADGQAQIRVRSLETFDRGLSWDYLPADRMEAYPTLLAQADAVGAAAREETVLLLTRSSDGKHLAHVLHRDVWAEVALPGDAASPWFVWATRDGLVAAELADGSLLCWSLGQDEAGKWNWSRGETVLCTPTERVWSIGAALVSAEKAGGDLVARVLSPQAEPMVTARMPLPASATVAPMYADGPRLITLEWSKQEKDRGYPMIQVRELSLGSGAVLFDGPVPRTELLSPGEFRVLAMMLVGLLIGVLVIVLKGDLDQDAVPLPPDTALASPARRLIATLIDLLVSAQLTGLLFGVKASAILTLTVLLQPGGAWAALPGVLVLGGLIGMLCEWGFGRTVGKLLTGCRVIRVGESQSGRLGLWGCFVRNAIKWLMPPVAALAAVDENSRHRGDQIAKAAVIIDLEPEPEGV